MRVSVPTSPLRTATAEEAHFGATLSEAYSVDSSVRIEASSAAIDSEVHVQRGISLRVRSQRFWMTCL
jgi:hypothetical protein